MEKRNQIMKIVVTGATSFIGAVTVRQLLEAGHQVYGVVICWEWFRRSGWT